MNDIIFKAENIAFSYVDTDEYALKGFNIELKRGRKIAFMGANGSGKSTFFLCMNGILRPSEGKLILDGEEVEYSKNGLKRLRSKIGIVFQDPDNQLFSASVRQEISFGPLNMGHTAEEVAVEVDEIMEKLEITPFSGNPTHALSGGQKKQVSIADVMVMKPEIIILDEPASSLDPKHDMILRGIVERMTEEGITVIISTHDVNFAYEWADDVVLVHDGKVIAEDSPDRVFSDSALLDKTNLKQPTVLELFMSLVRKGILSSELETPKNIGELETYIERI